MEYSVFPSWQAMLKGRVHVVPCMVDRICADRTVDGKGLVKVSTNLYEPLQKPILNLYKHLRDAYINLYKPLLKPIRNLHKLLLNL